MEELGPLKILLSERDAHYKEKLQSLNRKNSVLEQETEIHRRKLHAYEHREAAFNAAKEEFRQDVKELERASMLLSQKERELDIQSEDFERRRRKYDAQIRQIQDELDDTSIKLTNTIEEYKRYRENIASETVSRKSYDDLTREYEQRVPKEAYDRMAVKVGELQRRMDHEFTPNENMEELRFKLKRLEQNLETHYVPNHVFQRASENAKAMQSSVVVLEESKDAAMEEIRKSEQRVSSLKSDLDKSDSMLKEYKLKFAEIQAEAERYKVERDQLREEALTSTQKLLDYETERNMMLTQIGNLKASSKRDIDSRIAVENQNLYLKDTTDKALRRVRELEIAESQRDEAKHEAEEWRQKTNELIRSLDTEVAKTQGIVAENEVLAQSYLDLSAKHTALEYTHHSNSTTGGSIGGSPSGASFHPSPNAALEQTHHSFSSTLHSDALMVDVDGHKDINNTNGVYMPPPSDHYTAEADSELTNRLNALEQRFKMLNTAITADQ